MRRTRNFSKGTIANARTLPIAMGDGGYFEACFVVSIKRGGRGKGRQGGKT